MSTLQFNNDKLRPELDTQTRTWINLNNLVMYSVLKYLERRPSKFSNNQ